MTRERIFVADRMSVTEGPWLMWRPYAKAASEAYDDPTHGAQNTRAYWNRH